MMHLTYHEHAKSEMYQREAGLRKALLNGTAYEVKPKRRLLGAWRRHGAPGPRGTQLLPGIQGR
jgi:hypothetical protein